MSTKTIIKRVALVTVSVLGLGVLSTVTPASAVTSSYSVQSATLNTATTTVAGRVGQQVSISPTATWSAVTGAGSAMATLSFAAAITAQPSGSAIYPSINSVTVGSGWATMGTGLTIGGTAIAAGSGVAGTSSTVSAINYATADGASAAAGTAANVGTVTFTPAYAGTYTVVVWNETQALTSATAGAQPALSGAESSQTFTVNVSNGIGSITLTSVNSTSVKSGSNGSLVKVQLKDASGNAATLSGGEAITLTPSGSGVIAKVNGSTASSTAGQAWSLSSANFNSSGIAWVNVTDAVAESITITATGSGVSQSTSLTFLDTTTIAAAPAVSSTTTGVTASSGTVGVPVGANSKTWRVAVTTGSNVGFTVTESTGNASTGSITGYSSALSYDLGAAANTTAGYAYATVAATSSATGNQMYVIYSGSGSTTVSGATQASGVVSVTPSNVNAVTGSTNSFTVNVKDNFRSNYAGQTVSMTVAGKNPTTTAVTAVTDAAGNATFSLTDANTNTAVTDTITFTAGSAVTSSVSYGTNAVSTVTLTTDDTTASVANDTTSAQAIATGYAGAQGGARTVTATVKNAAGALLAGVPVTFTVSGTGAAVTSTTKTVYTGVAGTASASVYGWITGTYTVTATAGGKSGTGTQTFYSTGNDSVRTVSATANGSQIIGKATDRFGNPVANATLYAKITSGSGNIAGSLTAQGTTDLAGTVTWVVSDGAATVTVSNISFSSPAGTVVGQTGAAKGYDIGGAGATALTAATVGTTTTAETGVGSSYDAAGVATATADATPSTSSDAIDAANEATDAANAATDAANAAAEAADAATAAAQDAQAAVAELATKVASLIAGIKAQITTLTNLVIKIQKKVRA